MEQLLVALLRAELRREAADPGAPLDVRHRSESRLHGGAPLKNAPLGDFDAVVRAMLAPPAHSTALHHPAGICDRRNPDAASQA
jgi:hypothetical protein